MKEVELRKVVSCLEKALDVLYKTDVRDSRIRFQYAMYRVALKLAEKGLDVNVGNEKEMKGRHDIEVADKIKIEVKSAEYQIENEVPYVTATFHKGKQIREKGFDYSIFVTFKGAKVKKMFVFTYEELKEVAEKPRPHLARYPKEQPCLLFYYPKYPKTFGHLLNIEKDLNIHSHKYENRWDKITSEIK